MLRYRNMRRPNLFLNHPVSLAKSWEKMNERMKSERARESGKKGVERITEASKRPSWDK